MTAKKAIMLTPGPTPLPPSVSHAMAKPILHHRTKEFGELFEYTMAEMRYVYCTKNTVLLMTTSGSGGMESAVVNLCSPGDKTIVHTTGAFGDRWVKILETYGLKPVVVKEEWGHAADVKKLIKALQENKDAKAVFFQHTDTSTGIVNDVKALAHAVREHSAAVSVCDTVSGLAAERLEVDAWGVDVAITGSQKGLMCAPGLAFAAVSEKAWKLAEASKLPKFYFDWKTMRKSLKDRETPYTPGVTLIMGQAEALRLIRQEGIENVWKRTADLAQYTRAWAKEQGLPLFAKDPANILTALRLPEGVDGQALIEEILAEEGISIAGGQVHLKGKIIRIAHMGFISKEDLNAGFAALEKRLARVKA